MKSYRSAIRRILAVASSVLWLSTTNAQTECGGVIGSPGQPQQLNLTCTSNSTEWLNKYRRKETYIPNSSTPIKYTNVRFFIPQRELPSGKDNFDETNPTHVAFLNDIVNEMNNLLANSAVPSDPQPSICGSCHIADTRLRISLKGITALRNNTQFTSGASVVSCSSLTNGNNEINILLSGIDIGLSYQSGCGGNTYLAMNNFYQRYLGGENARTLANITLHEIGHAWGLSHVYESPAGQCCSETCNNTDIDYLSDVFGPGPNSNCWFDFAGDPFDPAQNSSNVFMVQTQFYPGYTYFSPQQLGRIHRNLSLPSTSNISRYACGYGSTAYAVTSNETWEFNIKFYQDIVVKAGNTLTIKCILNMVPGSSIIVEQNAKLIVDGGLITTGTSSGCSGLWQGIQVWGNSSQHQQAYATNQYYQGQVEMKNQARIENANTAISLGKQGDWQMLYTGGFVKASGNSVFRNNKRDVEFLKYQNFNASNPSIKLGNVSYFRNCTFETTAALNDGTAPSNHITMWNVDGVRLYGCTFENSNPSVTSLTQLGNGIYTEDANFLISACDWTVTCAPTLCCNYAPNTFRNLNIGVNAKYVYGDYNYNIDQNNFVNCVTGIQNDGVNNAIITRNSLTLGRPRLAAFITTGVGFNTGTGYRIEENSMTRDAAPNTTANIGCVITTTGMVNNQVYKNSFTNLYVGGYSSNRNRGLNSTYLIYTGLAFLCNNFSGSSLYDQYIYSSATDPSLDGVRQYNGKLNGTGNNVIGSAGNCFTRSGLNTESDISNPNTPNFSYYYDGTTTLPNCKYPSYVTTGKITRAGGQTANTCPSSFSTGGGSGKSDEHVYINTGKLEPNSRESLIAKYSELNKLLHDSREAYFALLDGSNSQTLQSEIRSSMPADVWLLRQKLIDVSPYLTKESFMASVETSMLPDAILAEILQANPELLKDEAVAAKLAETQFPAWMLNALKENNADITSSRTYIEGGLSQLLAERDQTISYIVQDMLQRKREGGDVSDAELRSWLANYQSAHGDYQLADNLVAAKKYSEAQDILSSIPVAYKLNASEMKEYEGVNALVLLLSRVEQEGRNLLQLTESELEQVQQLADLGEGLAQVRACNLLGFVKGTECVYKVEIPNTGSPAGKKENGAAQVPSNSENSVNLFPNPAKEYVEVNYDMTMSANREIEILNENGIVVSKKTTSGAKGQVAVDIRDLPSGTYFCKMNENGKEIVSKKFVIIK